MPLINYKYNPLLTLCCLKINDFICTSYYHRRIFILKIFVFNVNVNTLFCLLHKLLRKEEKEKEIPLFQTIYYIWLDRIHHINIYNQRYNFFFISLEIWYLLFIQKRSTGIKMKSFYHEWCVHFVLVIDLRLWFSI